MIRDPSRTRTALLAQRHATSALGARTSALWQRLRQDRLPLTASSLTYTTVLALVPLFTVILSVFTMFPIFAEMQGALQQSLVDSLIPESIAGNVMRYLNEFAGRAGQLGLLGIAGLVVTSLSLILTIDKTLNQIWRVTEPRRLGERVLIYWALLTLGPLLLAASIAMTSYVLSASSGMLPALPVGADFALSGAHFALVVGGLALLYHFVPRTAVRWRHALAGALVATMAFSLARWGMGLYLAHNRTYSHVYGAFAAVPVLLLWIYVSWLIVLLGAVVAAYLPSLASPLMRRLGAPGWAFELALEALRALAASRGDGGTHGSTSLQLARALKVDVLHLYPILGTLESMGWVGRLAPGPRQKKPRWVLLVDPAQVPAQALVDRFLVASGARLVAEWRARPLDQLTVADVLPG